MSAVPACDVWWADPRVVATRDVRATVSQWEWERASRFRNADDAARSRVGAWLLRLVAAGRVAAHPASLVVERTCVQCGRPHGRPLLPSHRELAVSVTHAGNRVGVAVATMPVTAVGLDVEDDDGTRRWSDLRTALSPREHARLAGLGERERERSLLATWVRKEAVLKASGHGLMVDPATVEVGAAVNRKTRAMTPAGEVATVVTLLPGDGHVAALAVVGAPEATVHEHWLLAAPDGAPTWQ